MHMADALLSPAVGGTMWAGTLAALSWAGRRLQRRLDDRVVPYMGVLAAFVFAAQMINFTIPMTGSSGHLGGGLLLAVLLGPHAAFLAIASVLFIQALFFADGGLLALGCNIWNLGIYPCFLAYPLIYRPLAGRADATPKRITLAAVLAAVAGLQAGAVSVVLETALSGVSELPFSTFLWVMQPIHLAIGLVEGLVTAVVVLGIRAIEPSALGLPDRPLEKVSLVKPLGAVVVAVLVVGGLLSWFASSNPDGLEWSMERVTGSGEIHGSDSEPARAAAALQRRTALMPGYAFKEESPPDGGNPNGNSSLVDPATSVAGIAGGVMVILLVTLVGVVLRLTRSRKTQGRATTERSPS